MEWLPAILLRLLLPLVILRSPILGSLLAIAGDNMDVVIWDYFGVKDFSPYNQIDKLLDTYIYLIQGVTVLKWQNKIAKKAALILLTHRVIGFVLYELTGTRLLLFLFPNLFLAFFLYYLVSLKILKKDVFTSAKPILTFLSIILVPKLLQEYMLHVSPFPFYATLKTHIFSKFLGQYGTR